MLRQILIGFISFLMLFQTGFAIEDTTSGGGVINSDYSNLQVADDSITEYTYWKKMYYSLLDQYKELNNKYNNLFNNYEMLKEDYSDLKDKYSRETGKDDNENEHNDRCGTVFKNGLIMEVGKIAYINFNDRYQNISLDRVSGESAFFTINGKSYQIDAYSNIEINGISYFVDKVLESQRNEVKSIAIISLGTKRVVEEKCFVIEKSNSHKIALGEGESNSVNINGNEQKFEILIVKGTVAVLKVYGEGEIDLSVGELMRYDNFYIEVTNVVDSSRNSVKGYAELNIVGIVQDDDNSDDIEENYCEKDKLSSGIILIDENVTVQSGKGLVSIYEIGEGYVTFDVGGEKTTLKQCQIGKLLGLDVIIHDTLPSNRDDVMGWFYASYQEDVLNKCLGLDEFACLDENACRAEYKESGWWLWKGEKYSGCSLGEFKTNFKIK